ncbi:putative serine/threonine-protein kinase MRK1 like protein, partial [Dictyocoela roeselum]
KYALKTVYEDNRYHNRELDILKSISHKNVIKLFGHFRTEESTSGSFVHLILEFIPFSLSDLILKDRICKTTLQRDNMFAGRHANVMQVYDVRDLYRDALRGLAYLHNLSICHRDIKPSNLMVDRAGQLKIADLGSAKQIYSGNRNIPYICSRPYRAPENLLGHDDYNVKIDIWALGCVFMEIFSKKPVFKVVDDAVQLKMILSIIQVSQKDIDKMNRKFDLHENVNCIGIKSFIKTFERFVDEDLIEVMVNSLVFNPEKRMMAKDLLEMPYFKRDKN